MSYGDSLFYSTLVVALLFTSSMLIEYVVYWRRIAAEIRQGEAQPVAWLRLGRRDFLFGLICSAVFMVWLMFYLFGVRNDAVPSESIGLAMLNCMWAGSVARRLGLAWRFRKWEPGRYSG